MLKNALLLLLCTAGGHALIAQRLERLPGTDSLAELRHLAGLRERADSLLGEWRRANAVADLVDSVDRGRMRAAGDTIAVGAVRIVANPSPLPLAEAARRAWPAIDSLYGVEAQGLAQHPYIIVAFDPDTTVPRPVLRSGMAVPWDMDVSSLALLLLTNVPMAEPDAALWTWLGGVVRPGVRVERQRGHVYVELVTAPSQAVQSCFVGDLAGCRYALDVVDAPDAFLRWYASPEERRAVVAKALPGMNRGGQERTFQACVEGGSDSACIAVLRATPKFALPRPLSHDARETLVHVALRLGGREAYHRLLANPAAPLSDRLTVAAGVSIDSLVAYWRAAILASRPTPVALPPWALWIALGWSAVFATCALRSSRWRVS